MADITWDNVVDVVASLATGVSANAQELILGHVNRVVAADVFGGDDSPTYMLAKAYLAAHYGYLNKTGNGAQGPTTSRSVGGISEGFANLIGPGVDPMIGSTAYGRAFLSMANHSPARAGFVL